MDYKFGDKCEFCAKVFKEKAGRTAKENHYRNCQENPVNKRDPELSGGESGGQKPMEDLKKDRIVRYPCPHCFEKSLEEGDNYCRECGGEIRWEED